VASKNQKTRRWGRRLALHFTGILEINLEWFGEVVLSIKKCLLIDRQIFLK
jgi:hypothetical protein